MTRSISSCAFLNASGFLTIDRIKDSITARVCGWRQVEASDSISDAYSFPNVPCLPQLELVQRRFKLSRQCEHTCK